ncbi:MAG: glycoside hydrolase family 127 protein [Chloroflexota bacterium]|nr:glycoside hydrolase family 127 protein [Chloroflexota bacterium]
MNSAAVLDLANSPHAVVRPVPPGRVGVAEGFWADRMRTMRSHGLDRQFEQCEVTGRLRNFERAAGRLAGEFEGRYYNDSDVYKWLEAASYGLARTPSTALRARVDGVIEAIAAAQRPDGYINSYFSGPRTSWRYRNLTDEHELYCMGHLIQAGVAHRRSTGSDRLFDIVVRAADHICATFGPEGRQEPDGHPGIELALVELGRETGNPAYLRRAVFFLDQRGADPPNLSGLHYHQDHAPVREQRAADGHSVRLTYLAAAMADAAMDTGEAELLEASIRLWESAYERRAYVTGGLGSRYQGEAFGADYELPNDRAYAETCAAVGGIFWNARLLAATGDARYADWLEAALYNGALVGVSPDGAAYFYANPLAADSQPTPDDQGGVHSSGAQQTGGGHRRQPWYDTACCPPNIARLLLSLPGYAYGVSPGALWVHQYLPGHVQALLPDGKSMTPRIATRYPWDGDVDLVVDDAPDEPVELRLRIPGWAEGASLEVQGAREAVEPGSYASIRRVWSAGTTLRLRLPMDVRLVASHPRVQANTGRVAIARGPVIYCIEAADHPESNVDALVLGPDSNLRAHDEPDLLGGLTTIRGLAGVAVQNQSDELYGRFGGAKPELTGTTSLTAIPYYAWANRTPGAMRVWIPYVDH